MKIAPRNKSDRGGYLIMPLKQNIRIQRMIAGNYANARCAIQSAGTDHFRKDLAKTCSMGSCARCAL